MATTTSTTSSTAKTTQTYGINVNKISKISTALDNYKAAVKKKCNMAASKAQIEKAIKGTASETSLTKMYNTIDVKMKSYLDLLDQYTKILATMKTSYQKNDTNNTTFSDITKKYSTGTVVSNTTTTTTAQTK